MGVIPVINENDTVSTTELEVTDRSPSFGDNDKLSALVMSKLEATASHPALRRRRPVHGQPSRESQRPNSFLKCRKSPPDIEALAGRKSARGRGGMATKLEAARIAMNSGGVVDHRERPEGRNPRTRAERRK